MRDWADYEGLEDEELEAEIAGLDGYLEKVGGPACICLSCKHPY